MALVTTGAAFGVTNVQDEIYIEGAPQIYFMDANGPYRYGPDANGFYWQLSGTSAYPVYALGCYENVALADNMEINAIRCDTVGDKGLIAKRNYLELSFTLKSFFPLANIAPLLSMSTVTTVTDMELSGFGQINNNAYYKIYLPKVYDETAGDYVAITGHRVRFVAQGQIAMAYGNTWTVPVIARFMADTTLPTGQHFATVIRSDASAL